MYHFLFLKISFNSLFIEFSGIFSATKERGFSNNINNFLVSLSLGVMGGGVRGGPLSGGGGGSLVPHNGAVSGAAGIQQRSNQNLQQDLAAQLAETIAQASSLIQAAGLAQQGQGNLPAMFIWVELLFSYEKNAKT